MDDLPAAIRDVLHVIERRQPGLEIIIAPCRVQGQGAAAEIAAAIRALNEFSWRNSESKLDLILATRGGGVAALASAGRSGVGGHRCGLLCSVARLICSSTKFMAK